MDIAYFATREAAKKAESKPDLKPCSRCRAPAKYLVNGVVSCGRHVTKMIDESKEGIAPVTVFNQ